MTTRLENLAADLRARLQEIYGVRLKGLYIYGSYARGDENPESDLDVLVVLDDVQNYWEEIQRTSEFISSLSLEYGVSMSRSFITQDQWLKDDSPFLDNLRREAVPA